MLYTLYNDDKPINLLNKIKKIDPHGKRNAWFSTREGMGIVFKSVLSLIHKCSVCLPTV